MALNSLRKFVGAPIHTVRNARYEKTKSPNAAPLPLTFGVELEMLLAVKKDLEGEDAWLRTGDFDNNRGRGERRRNLERRYMANSNESDKYLVYAMRILDRAEYPVEMAPAMGRMDVSKWNVKEDVSVLYRSIHELRRKLPDRVADIEEWTRPGSVELISRVLPVPAKLGTLSSDPSLFEVEGYMHALSGRTNDPYGVFTNETCGLHVHIGQDPRRSQDGTAALPLDVLQHLSYILIQFEPLISSLHPPSRRSLLFSPSNTYLDSNTLTFRPSRHICRLGGPLDVLEQIEEKIFTADMTTDRLVALMSETLRYNDLIRYQRWKYVNYTRLLGFSDGIEPVDKTIEFRQHAGSVNPEHVSHWILFVTSLVRAAEKKARQNKPATPASPLTPRTALQIHQALAFPRQQGNKYHLKCQSQFDEFERLFDLLEFEAETRQYWLDRYARFCPEGVTTLLAGEPLPDVEQSQCPICHDELSPDTRRTRTRELQQERQRLGLIWDLEDDDG